ncbi:MAG: hypothetical protein C5B50_14800 [Verrucomicrobia bacterium]|nr:MAG: hypothetical protein C5B50_14800 [Verrucomicrobiota bacterium]
MVASRSDGVKVAVGLSPRYGTEEDFCVALATLEAFFPLTAYPHFQASLRDAPAIWSIYPWAEAHGYFQRAATRLGPVNFQFAISAK